MFLLYFPSLLAQLGMFSCVSLQNKKITKTYGNYWFKVLFLGLVLFFDEFYISIGGIKCESRTANTFIDRS
jgi:hypothetical protein